MTLATDLTADERQAINAFLERNEGYFEYMYLDSVGRVTIGLGTMLPDAAAAHAIEFFREDPPAQHLGRGPHRPQPQRPTGPVTAAEINQQFNLVARGAEAQRAAGAAGFAARHYRTVTYLRITRQEGDRLRDQHLELDLAALQHIYGHFNDFPQAAKVALFDMCFNLGEGRNGTRARPGHPAQRATGLRAFVTMNAAINHDPPQWELAAQRSARHPIGGQRNADTAALFRRCVIPRGAQESPHLDGRPRRPAQAPAAQPPAGPGAPPVPGAGPVR